MNTIFAGIAWGDGAFDEALITNVMSVTPVPGKTLYARDDYDDVLTGR